MKDSLFEMLLGLFEKTLSRLKENYAAGEQQSVAKDTPLEASNAPVNLLLVNRVRATSIRVFTAEERAKLTKASYQFLMRISSWGLIAQDTLELIMNQLIFSDSRFVTLQETKWAIRNCLAHSLDAKQLAFLDLVLYHKEDELSLH